MDKYDFEEKYTGFEEGFIPRSRQARRVKKPRHEPPKSWEMPAEIADMQIGGDGIDFNPTYMQDHPDNKERQWIIKYLKPFYTEEMITDVVASVKAGKEASVYVCEANPSLGVSYVAAKIYRPAIFRSLKNDALYREGRFTSRANKGTAATLMNGREHRAMEKGSRIGKEIKIGTWIGHEYQIMQKLFEAGVHVPEPIAHKGNAILMEFVGDGARAAPPLHNVTLEDEEAQRLFLQLLQDVEIMLANDCIHGDFSAYNILYAGGAAMIIDFPQAVEPFFNQSALPLLERDVTRLCQYFSSYNVLNEDGHVPDPIGIVTELWRRFMENEL
jgi:RIO kinase 1